MTSKTNALSDALKKAKAGKQPEQESQKMEMVKATIQDRGTPPSRVGKKPAIAYIDPAGMRELKMLAVETGRSQQDMLLEAINDFLIKNGKKAVA